MTIEEANNILEKFQSYTYRTDSTGIKFLDCNTRADCSKCVIQLYINTGIAIKKEGYGLCAAVREQAEGIQKFCKIKEILK